MLERFFGPPDRQQFARLVIAGIRRAGEQRKIHFDADQSGWPEGAEVSLMNLSNVYAEYCSAGKSQRPKLLSSVVRNWFADRRSLPDAFEDIHPDLLPTVRSRSYFEFAALQLKSQGCGGVIHYPQQVLAEHLAIGLVYDLPDSMRTIVDDDLEHWGVSFYEALEAACTNLRQKEDPVFVSPHEGVYLSATGDNYDASRLILTDMIHQFDVRGDVIAMVANRDTLIVTGSENSPGLKLMIGRARQALEEPRPISAIALRLVDDEWQEWLPPEDSSLYHDFSLLRLQSVAQQYAEQKELLDMHFQKQGEEVFVASYCGAQQNGTEKVISYCVWSDGVDSLLPKSDLVYFYQGGGAKRDGAISAISSWQSVEAELGALIEPEDMYPPRFRVRSFPSADQLSRINTNRRPSNS